MQKRESLISALTMTARLHFHFFLLDFRSSSPDPLLLAENPNEKEGRETRADGIIELGKVPGPHPASNFVW